MNLFITECHHLSKYPFQNVLAGHHVNRRSLCTKNDEVAQAAKAAADAAKTTLGQPTIFSKIIDKSIPADILYEDDLVSRSIALH